MKLVLEVPEKKQSSSNSCCQDEGQLLEYHGQEQEANRRKSILSFLWPLALWTFCLPLMPSLNELVKEEYSLQVFIDRIPKQSIEGWVWRWWPAEKWGQSKFGVTWCPCVPSKHIWNSAQQQWQMYVATPLQKKLFSSFPQKGENKGTR